jgi:hypothetical protein
MTTVLLVAFFACMAVLCGLLWWQHRTILSLAARRRGDNYVIVRLRAELLALATRHGEQVPMIYFAGIAIDEPIEREG